MLDAGCASGYQEIRGTGCPLRRAQRDEQVISRSEYQGIRGLAASMLDALRQAPPTTARHTEGG